MSISRSTRPSRSWRMCCWALLAAISAPAYAQFTDTCSLAPLVPEGTFTFNLSAATASAEPIEPACAVGRNAIYDQWIRYVPTFTGPAAISTEGLTAGDTVLSIHQDFCDFPQFVERFCSDDTNGTPQSRIQLSVTAGEPVLIRIAGALASRPAGAVRIEPLAPLPIGDTCSNPDTAVLGVNIYDVTRAVDNGFTGCFGSRDVWFTFTPQVTGALTVSTCGQRAQPNITILEQCEGFTLACSKFLDCFAGTAVQAGVPVLIRLANEDAIGPETFTISIDPSGIPANDNCDSPATATLGNTAFNNTYATTEFDEFCPGGGIFGFNGGLDLWYQFTPAVTGFYDISTDQSTDLSDTKLAVFESCFGNAIGCNDDSRGFLSFIRLELVGGQTYLIQISGTGLPLGGTPIDRGQGILTIRRSIPPANDECDTATTVGLGTHEFDVYDATTGPQSPSCVPELFRTDNDVWFRYVPAQNGPVEARIPPNGVAYSLSAFRDCEDLLAVQTAGNYFNPADGSDTPRMIVRGQAGVPILFRVAFAGLSVDPLRERGDGILTLSAPTTPTPSNDLCENALPLPVGVTQVDLTGSIKDCTIDTRSSFDASAGITENDLFYRFTSAQTGPVRIFIDDGFDYPAFDGLVVSVYDGCGQAPIAGSFTLGDAPRNSLLFQTSAGQTYIVRVGSVLRYGSGTSLTGTLTVQRTVACPADLTDDGFVDDSDFVLFASQYEIFDCTDPNMSDHCSADFNADSFVDDTDFVTFATAYENFTCD